ncbi:hypothetical protein EO95_17960 [Methanosarcina sp. 1.H.T.1A.1]|nr:hypothetical protein EO95_17960 [Methanosarcina sp. 1.H.T.1A.1]
MGWGEDYATHKNNTAVVEYHLKNKNIEIYKILTKPQISQKRKMYVSIARARYKHNQNQGR